MTHTRFMAVLPLVLVHEGGFVNHPKDPGGATNRGVTQRTYDGWRSARGLNLRSVVSIQAPEVAAIYEELYWDAVRASYLDVGLDYAVFDFAVNSGPVRAIKELQKAAGVPQDGLFGPATLLAVRRKDPLDLIKAVCSQRLSFLRRLRRGELWKTFGRGWSRRVEEVKSKAFADALCAFSKRRRNLV